MKKTLFISAFCFLLSAFVGAQYLSTADGLVQLTTVPSGASLTCQAYASTSYAGNNYSGGTMAQKIQGSSSGLIVCSCWLYTYQPSGLMRAELWSNPNGTGTQYGVATPNVDASSDPGFFYFTWATPISIPPNTDFYIVWFNAGYYADGSGYVSGYKGYQNGSVIPDNTALLFGLNTMQP